MSNSEILQKIKKLREKGQSAEKIGNKEEAEAFLSKVSELLAEYNLSFLDLDDLDKKEKAGIEYDEGVYFMLYDKKEQGRWKMDLISVLCRFNFCTAIFRGNGTDKFRASIVGTPINTEVITYMYETAIDFYPKIAADSYAERVKNVRAEFTVKAITKEEALINLKQKLVNDFEQIINDEFALSQLTALFFSKGSKNQERKAIIKQMMNNLTADDLMPQYYGADKLNVVEQEWCIKSLNKIPLLISDRGAYIRNFLLGVSIGIAKKCTEQRNFYKQEEDKKEVPENHTLNALVKINDQEIEKFCEERFGKLKSIANAASSIYDKKAFKQGMNSGYEKGVNKGLNTGNSSKTGLLG